MQLAVLPYHVALADHLEQAEPELWQRFHTALSARRHQTGTMALLMRSASRLERSPPHEQDYRLAGLARDALELEEDIVLYRLNEGLSHPLPQLILLAGEIALAVAEPSPQAVDDMAERLALLGREIARYKLYTTGGGRIHTLERLLEWATQREDCSPEWHETFRRCRLFAEIYCDMGSLLACRDREVVIRRVARSASRAGDNEPGHDADEIARLANIDPTQPRGTTHLEVHMRAVALMWADTLSNAERNERLEGLVCGNPELGSLDVIDQRELVDLTRKMIDRFVGVEPARLDRTLAYVRQMFPGYTPPPEPLGLKQLSPLPTASVTDYLAYLLLDLATVEATGLKGAIAVAAAAADDLGIGARFREIARQELRGRRGLHVGLAPRAA